MKNINYQKCVAIIFTIFIILSGVLTMAFNPVKILGGLARGYLNTDKEENVLTKIGNGFQEFDNRVNNGFIFHDQSINAYGAIQNFIGKTLIDDVDPEYTVLKLKNDYLTFKDNSYSDYTKFEKNLLSLNEFCTEKNINLFYVNKIDKQTDNIDLLPKNYPYIFGSNYESFENNIKNAGISVLDINNIVEENNIDKYSLFFKTDHHWTPKTGLWVSQLIADNLNNKFNYQLNSKLFDISNYNIETYKSSFLGSQGKRVGKYYAGVDDFDIITPKYDTDITLSIPEENITLNGSFEDTMIHRESFTPNNLLNQDDTAYDVYMSGNHSLVTIKNNNIKNGKTALLVLDSFGCVVAPYLSQAFSNFDCIDLRSFKDTKLTDYIAETTPDVVIYMTQNYR